MRAYPASQEVDAMRIQVTSGHPAQSALVANLYAEEYIARTKERSRESLEASRQFLEQQARTLEEDLEAAETKIEDYMQTHEAVSLDRASSEVVGRISELEARRSELQIELDMKRAALEDLEAELADAEPQLAERLSSSLDERLQRVQKEKAELETRIDLVEQRNPGLNGGGTRARQLRKMRRRVDRLQQKADSLARAYVDQSLAAGAAAGEDGGTAGVGAVAQKRQRASQLRIDISGLEAQLDVVDRRLDEQQSRLQSIPEQSMELAQLQRERRSTEQIYSFVREKLQETRLSEQSEIGFAEVVRPAYISRTPIGPSLTQNLILALLLGLGGGSVVVVVWAKLDTHVRQPDDLRDKGYALAGVVPPMDDLIRDQFGDQERVQIDGQSMGTELIMLTSPMSAAAEAYRRVRTNLQFARPDTPVRTIAVTSAEQGEGKTTTAANLALAFASAGKDTLLVDADLRHPRQHTIFGGDREPGLSHRLFDGSIETSTFATGIDHLSVLPAGDTVPNPAELLGSARMESLLDDLKRTFDIVLLDTPPVLLFSDGLVLASHCDGTLLVAAADQSDGRAVDHAAEQVGDVDGTLLGCVLNRYEGESALYGYGSNYGYARGQRQVAAYYREKAGASSNGGGRTWWRRT
jgi:capsular exopolysaccharide synthesis family protein